MTNVTMIYVPILLAVVVTFLGIGLLVLNHHSNRTRQLFYVVLASFFGLGSTLLTDDSPGYEAGLLVAVVVGFSFLLVETRLFSKLVQCPSSIFQSRSMQASALILVGVTGTSGALWQLSEPADIFDENQVMCEDYQPEFREVESAKVYTDRGRKILIDTIVEPKSQEQLQEAEERILTTGKYAYRLIRTGAPDSSFNCHGWVFSNGMGHIHGKDVTFILEDNGYVTVEQPQPDDVVVYRDATGGITHTGLVRTLDSNGTVMVESKWGVMGRYLHAVKDCGYGTRYEFYHSLRPGRMLSQSQPLVAVSEPLELETE